MNRKLWLGISTAAILAPGLSHALSVGSYQLNSYLNQPLSMDIPLTKADDLSDIEIVVNLASPKEFENAGIIRSGNLATMGFTVTLDGKGGGNIRVSTREPINEPYMDFLVQIMWPTGRILREYTVLLDPPSYGADTTQAVSAPPSTAATVEPAQASQDYQVVEELPPLVTAADSSAPATTSVTVSQPTASTTTHTTARSFKATHEVQNGDTLWSIASRYRDSNDVSIQQVVVAIERANPDAFYVSGNANFVKAGAVLQIPSEEMVRDYDARGAMQDLAEQNRYWRQLLNEKGIVLGGDSEISGGSSQIQRSSTGAASSSRGEVTLLAASDADPVDSAASASSGATRGAAGSSSDELALKAESLDRLSQENQELNSRIKDLNEQLDTSNKLLELRNGQIAELQAQLQKAQVTSGQAVAAVTEAANADEAGSAVKTDAVVETVEENDAAGELAATETTGAETIVGAEQAEAGAEDVVEPAEETADVVTTPVDTTADVAQVTEEPGLVQRLMDNLLLIGGVLLLIVLLLAALVSRRRNQAQTQAVLADYDDEDDEGEDDFLAVADDQSDELDDLEDSFDEAVELADEAELHAGETDQDPLEAVEAYVAYGRYQQAIDFLRDQTSKQPDRSDLKIRLLEVEKEAGDDSAFNTDAARFAGDSAEVDACIDRLGGVVETTLDELEKDLAAELPAELPEANNIAEDGLDEFGDFELDDALSDGADIVVGGQSKPDELIDYIDSTDVELAPVDEQALSLDDQDHADILSEDDLQAMDTDSAAISLDEDFSLEATDDAAPETVAGDGFGADNLDADLDDLAFDLSEESTDLSLETTDEQSLEVDTSDVLDIETSESIEPDLELTDIDHDSPEAESVAIEPVVAKAEETLDLGSDDNFDFLSDTDENATKLDLARAYIDMGDKEGAKDILGEVLAEGNDQQKAEANELIAQLG